LLLHSGFYVYYESNDFSELTKRDAVQVAYTIFKDIYPIHRWFVDNIV
jgi:hypothetical protein